MLKNLRDAAEFAKSRIHLRNWSNSELDSRFGKRSAAEIIEEGHAFFMKPCFDFYKLFLNFLKEKEQVTAIADEVKSYGIPILHFAVQCDEGYIHYLGVNTISIMAGKYHSVGKMIEIPESYQEENLQVIAERFLHSGSEGLSNLLEILKKKKRIYENYLAASDGEIHVCC